MKNWDVVNLNDLVSFVNGMSGRTFYAIYVNTKAGPHVRNLLREHGVAKARQLAKRALKRRVSVGN